MSKANVRNFLATSFSTVQLYRINYYTEQKNNTIKKKKTKLHINVKIFSCVFLELTCWKCRRSRKKLNEACFQSKQRDTIFGVRLLTKKSSRSLINSCIKCLTWSKAWRVLELMWSHKHSENSECWLLWIAQTLSALTEKVKTKFRN